MEDNEKIDDRSLLKKSRINSAKKKKSERERLSRLSGANINDLLQTQPDQHRDSVDFGSTGELALQIQGSTVNVYRDYNNFSPIKENRTLETTSSKILKNSATNKTIISDQSRHIKKKV